VVARSYCCGSAQACERDGNVPRPGVGTDASRSTVACVFSLLSSAGHADFGTSWFVNALGFELGRHMAASGCDGSRA
jgi:hypothetical protein